MLCLGDPRDLLLSQALKGKGGPVGSYGVLRGVWEPMGCSRFLEGFMGRGGRRDLLGLCWAPWGGWDVMTSYGVLKVPAGGTGMGFYGVL